MKIPMVITGLLLCGCLLPVSGMEVVEVEDAFESRRVLNPKDKVAVVLYSNPSLQDKTRAAGRKLDGFLARNDFQYTVLVDLRGSLAHWATGYTRRRMQRDLKEKIDNLPRHVVDFHEGQWPRPDISVAPDFDGEICKALGWADKSDESLRVLVFQRGKIVREWEDLAEIELLESTVRGLLDE